MAVGWPRVAVGWPQGGRPLLQPVEQSPLHEGKGHPSLGTSPCTHVSNASVPGVLILWALLLVISGVC